MVSEYKNQLIKVRSGNFSVQLHNKLQRRLNSIKRTSRNSYWDGEFRFFQKFVPLNDFLLIRHNKDLKKGKYKFILQPLRE